MFSSFVRASRFSKSVRVRVQHKTKKSTYANPPAAAIIDIPPCDGDDHVLDLFITVHCVEFEGVFEERLFS